MAETAWTDEQKAAITAAHDVLLTANAGTGKTTTVVGKILWLLGLDIGLPLCPNPCGLDEIAAITFTEKAAHDLKNKLREAIEVVQPSSRAEELVWQIDRAALGTIHSFCGQILREYALRLGIDPTFTILDERASRLEQDAVIRQVLMDAIAAGDEGAADLISGFTLTGYQFSSGAMDHIRDVMRDIRWHSHRYDKWCNDGALDTAHLQSLSNGSWDDLDDANIARCGTLVRLATTAFAQWSQRMLDENFRDFDAIILDTRALLAGEHGSAARTGLQRRYRILVMDEFQDTDAAQRDIAYAIGRGQERPHLFLVGDPKQSIYGFRGADISVWNEVARDFGASSTLMLSRNYRSEPAVIDFVNVAIDRAMTDTAAELEAEMKGTSVGYSALDPSRKRIAGAVEWLQHTDDKRHRDWLSARIEQIVGKIDVVDPRTGVKRVCEYRDIAVLYRSRAGGAEYQADLRRRSIPFYEQGQAGLMARQEVLDILNALRVIHNPSDDLRVFAFLRSPFVGLRDEVIARFRLDTHRGSLLQQAAKYCENDAWFAAPEHNEIADVERQALIAGVSFIDSMRALADRLPLDELIEHMLDATGYRAHLHLLDGTREAIAGIYGVIRVAEEFRDRSLGTFLDLWSEWDDADQGLPQAPLYSSRDNVVTLSTIHAAKGLEWPVVILINVGAPERDQSANQYWSDADLGPILCPKKDDRGPRAIKLWRRKQLEERAEEVRLLYVAATRARDRLVIIGGEKPVSFGGWMATAQNLVEGGVVTANPPEAAVRNTAIIPLDWLSHVAESTEIPSVVPITEPQPRWITSATEQMLKSRDEKTWSLLYNHGVQPSWMFARSTSTQQDDDENAAIPATLHGTIVHGVLERIRDEQDLADILEETIGDLAAPELEGALGAGTAYRSALEDEIRQVIRGADWIWYVEGEHYRELPFLHLAGPKDWRTGAFDLYRSDTNGNWIIDFKTHDITADKVEHASQDYVIQARVYREAAAMHGGARVRLHFTRPNVVIDMGES